MYEATARVVSAPKDEQAKYAKVKSLQAIAIEMDQLGKHEKPIRA